jgi:hypothetical protein
METEQPKKKGVWVWDIKGILIVGGIMFLIKYLQTKYLSFIPDFSFWIVIIIVVPIMIKYHIFIEHKIK